MCTHLKFSHKKTTQMLNYFAIASNGSINKMKVIKLIYFADKYHLRKYGRPISNDEYYAMPYGPVGSGAKDIAEMSDFLAPEEKEYASNYINSVEKYYVTTTKKVDENVLSDSDLEALKFSWEKFGSLAEFRLARLSHEYPEWQKHEENLKSLSRIRMNYEDFLDDPERKTSDSVEIEKCFHLDENEKKDRREQLKEVANIESLWG